MSFSPSTQVLHFVDEETNTLNAVQRTTPCQRPVASRSSIDFERMLSVAEANLGKSFSILRNYSCTVDPQFPDAVFFDQVHDDTGYASDNPDVQSDMAGKAAEAALLANRTDCGPTSPLNFDQLLLGGYFCHHCLPDNDGAMCDGGETGTFVTMNSWSCEMRRTARHPSVSQQDFKWEMVTWHCALERPTALP